MYEHRLHRWSSGSKCASLVDAYVDGDGGWGQGEITNCSASVAVGHWSVLSFHLADVLLRHTCLIHDLLRDSESGRWPESDGLCKDAM